MGLENTRAGIRTAPLHSVERSGATPLRRYLAVSMLYILRRKLCARHDFTSQNPVGIPVHLLSPIDLSIPFACIDT